MNSCWLCDERVVRLHVVVSGHRIVACDACGVQWVEPPPSAAELATVYEDPAYFHAGAQGYEDYLGEAVGHRRQARQRLEALAALAPPGTGEPGTILDLGCAAGFFLAEAAARGWRVAGVERSAAMRRLSETIAPGRIFAETADAVAALRRVDIATMWEYLEHVPHPLGELRRVAGLLRPGGLIAISTPNTDHRAARATPRRWREYRPPAHVNFFTDASLRRCLQQTGYVPLETRFTTPLMSHDALLRRGLEALGRRLGTAATRRTPLWMVYSFLYRLHAIPARLVARIQPERFCAGLELYARRR